MTAVYDDRYVDDPYALDAQPDPAAGPDLATLFGELREETRLLVGKEIELAKAELDEAKGHLIKGVVGYVAAGVLAIFAVVLLSIAAAWGLAEALPTWAAFLIVGGAWVVIAAIAFTVGRSALRRFDPVPRRTIRTLKEDARWVQTLTN
jgi:uncharacterized membrane protein YqjE